MRLAEFFLFATPILMFLMWYFLSPDDGFPNKFVIFATFCVFGLAIMLIILWIQDSAPPDATYVPSRQDADRIIPGYLTVPAEQPR